MGIVDTLTSFGLVMVAFWGAVALVGWLAYRWTGSEEMAAGAIMVLVIMIAVYAA